MLPCICIRVIAPNNIQTRVLFILSRIINEAREAAAPSSNPIARETASQYGLESLKNSITWIVEIILTSKYKDTKVPMMNLCTSLSFISF
jgi:hypothetical protein